MAIADNRKRYMPLPEDRLPNRGQPLAYPEAVLLTNPVEPELKGEVSSSSSLSFRLRGTKNSIFTVVSSLVCFF